MIFSLRGAIAAGLLLLGVGACRAGEGLTTPADLTAPTKVTATPLNLRTIRVQWNAVKGAQSYRVERRANLTGDFTPIAPSVPQNLPGPVVFLDNAVEPETFYGYRVYAEERLGVTSSVSAVAGARTPSLPGLDITTIPVQDGASLIEDPDGYTVVVAGPDTVRRPFATRATERVGPLRVGTYRVSLDGIAANCHAEQSPLVVPVSDTGTQTIAAATFRVSCRDATRGEIVVSASVAGEPPTAAQYRIEVTGVAADQSLPAAQRAYSATVRLPESGAPFRLRDLRPGDYQVGLDSLPSVCSAQARRRDVDVGALTTDTVRFVIECEGSGGGGNLDRPYIYRNQWSPQSASTGSTVELRLSLDLTRTPTASFGAVEANLRYDTQALRFDRIEALDPRFNVVGNGAIPGTVSWGGFTTTIGATGEAAVAKMIFTVIGANGGRAVTRTSDVRATFFDFTQIDTLVRVVEDTLSIGSGPGSNTPPTAEANGPYSAAIGGSITFSSAGSGDADGTVQTYAWNFGDGSTGTGPSPTKSYAAAGSYTVVLTVTDDKGATASDQAVVTIGGAPSTSPPTWKATFGTLDPGTATVPLVITYDLSGDVAATPGPEALESWVVDSLKWDPAVLKFFAFNFGPGGSGSVNPTAALTGKLVFRGSQPAPNSTGVITIATIRFKVVGSGGRTTGTSTALGALTGTAGTGGFAYRPITTVAEGSYTVAGGSPAAGTVAGSVTRVGGGAIGGANVTVAPGGSTTTNGSGQFAVTGVAVGSGMVTLSALPSGCAAPTAKTYTIAAGGQTATVDFAVTCSTPSTTGTVTGTVSRTTGGGIAGATVSVTPGGSAVTTATGGYSVGSVAVGSGTVAVSNLPAGCTAPPPKPYTIAGGGQTATVDFAVTCSTPSGTGTVSGTVRRAGGAVITGAAVAVTPGGNTTTSATGQYSVAGVPVGSGTVAISGLPAGCTAPSSKAYTIASSGQTVDVSFDVTCPAPTTNSISGKWTVSGTTATLELRANLVSGNLGTLEAKFAPGSSRLQYTGSAAATAPAFPNTFAGNPPQTVISFGAFTLAASGLTGDVGIIKLTFTIVPGAVTTVNGVVSNLAAANAAFADITPTFAGGITIDPLPLP